MLWVRSYLHGEGLLIPLRNEDGMRFASFRGRIGCEPDPRPTQWEWRIEPAAVSNFDWDKWERNTPHWILGQNNRVLVPHWFAVIVAGSLSAALWLRWSFSLRTLLIATTLVAVGLALIVWLR